MKRDLAYFQGKYGWDFVNKLPYYKTAKLNKEHVSLVLVDIKHFKAMIKTITKEKRIVSIFELDNFVL